MEEQKCARNARTRPPALDDSSGSVPVARSTARQLVLLAWVGVGTTPRMRDALQHDVVVKGSKISLASLTPIPMQPKPMSHSLWSELGTRQVRSVRSELSAS